MVDVSIIMPVYNSEKYVGIAIESILSQSYENFELLLVDDGSKDNSGNICDEYASKDKRIRVFHKENGGMCSARNLGLQKAAGKYITFCDNDDIFLPNLLKDNYMLAQKYNADIVRFSRARVHIDNGEKTQEAYSYQYDFSFFEGEEILENYDKARNISSGVWCNLYRKKIIEKFNIKFAEDFRFGYEDMLFNIQFYKYVNKVVLNPNVYYQWIQRDTHSTTKKYSDNILYALQICLDEEYKFIKEMELEKKYQGSWEDILTNYYVFGYYLCLLNAQCPYTPKEKIALVKKFKNQDAFMKIDKESLKKLKKKNFKRYFTCKLFLHGHHRLNFKIIDVYSRKISKIM